jgi:hypothetical protein
MAYTYSKIATYTVGSGGVASIDFLNIPQTYTDLVLKLSARTAAGSDDAFYVRFNNTTTGYSGKRLWANGSSVGSDSPEYFGTVPYSSLTASTFGNAEVYIPNYTGSTNKSASTDATQENNATFSVLTMVASLWSNTAPITSIKITSFTGSNFAQYSTAHLYGIKAEL